ncbi:circularly permuted type 2 ATP-grasp protein [Chthonobacter rhizosphaerae]|uniref:circularly permuted type 2 ATP-grasp protein n=1 Tax=Chthonobacter rhizosphaerae TaxID=2735553 RepID=UPI0015EF5E1D|nr:circularly permuted type 2 ATP-grasp protein [Chthonobacter rhizosphaerae]
MTQKQTPSPFSRAAAPGAPRAAWVREALAAYRPLQGVYDELMRPDGSLREPWSRFFDELGGLSRGQIGDAFASADRHLKGSGVFYRVYDDPAGGERPWPLAPVPLLIGAREWAALKEGVVQRARLAEAILADLYGDGRLVRDGVLPAAAVAGSPDFLRPLVGLKPPGGRHLHFYAVDIGRGPDGSWWVLSDRTQAPSGAGYAVENRIALSRALPETVRALHVERLAAFFQTFRDELARLNARAEARVGLLTPGPLNETYFEHAYLARYLGFLLVEGGDLTVRDGAVYVRTVSGLKRVDVLWRRLDGDFADPLELRTSSRLGVPGLVQAIREGGVTVSNALGSGVVESRALMGFMPALARAVLGEDLILPNLATWWCGQPREREVVLDNLDSLVVAPAFEPEIPGLPGVRTLLGSALSASDRATFLDIVRRRGMDVVGQEAVRLSTMPVWQDGRLTPRPFVLRLFLAATGDDGWTVMPGGFCRISGSTDARFVSLQQGASASDVWVIGEGPVAETSLLPTPDKVRVRRTTGTLPSRAADNLFWLARYLERTEATLRLVRALLGRVVEGGVGADRPLVDRLVLLLKRMGALPADSDRLPPARLAIAVLTDRAAVGALPQTTAMARSAAAVIRDRLAPDAFQTVTEIATRFERLDGRPMTPGQALDLAGSTLRLLAAYAGLQAENMSRLTGWRFLEIGRRIERAVNTARFVRQFGEEGAPAGALEVMLELGDSQITYRSRYVVTPSRVPVLDLLVLDGNNPRSVAFQVHRVLDYLETLPGTTVDGRPVPVLRSARRLSADLDTLPVEDMAILQLDGVVNELFRLSEGISERFFRQAPSEDLPEDLG